jgi:hypothetical protein
MTDDFEDAINLDRMEDEDIRDLVHQLLDEAEAFDADAVEIEVENGRVRVEGRVGTEGERQRVDQVLTSLGAADYENNVVVDRLARADRDESADIARMEDAAAAPALGASSGSTSDEAQHLRPDDAGELYGTRDMGRAIQEGKTYEPPDGPIQEGIEGDERH